MAGRGPRPNAQRQRRNVPTHGDYRRLEPLEAPLLPELSDLGPAPTASGEWPPISAMLWDAWRESPVTATWAPEDTALAVDTLALHAKDPHKFAAEIRIRIDNLGLSPKGRRDARLLLPDENEIELAAAPAEPTPIRALPEAK